MIVYLYNNLLRRKSHIKSDTKIDHFYPLKFSHKKFTENTAFFFTEKRCKKTQIEFKNNPLAQLYRTFFKNVIIVKNVMQHRSDGNVHDRYVRTVELLMIFIIVYSYRNC